MFEPPHLHHSTAAPSGTWNVLHHKLSRVLPGEPTQMKHCLLRGLVTGWLLLLTGVILPWPRRRTDFICPSLRTDGTKAAVTSQTNIYFHSIPFVVYFNFSAEQASNTVHGSTRELYAKLVRTAVGERTTWECCHSSLCYVQSTITCMANLRISSQWN